MSWVCAMAMGVLNPEALPVATGVAVQRYAARHPGPATVDVSADGRFVAFESWARLSPLDTNTLPDVYVLDRRSDRLTLESQSWQGESADGSSAHPRLSGDGRYLVFESVATNLFPGRSLPLVVQVILRDRQTGTMALVSRGPDGAPGNRWSTNPDINDDGRVIVFESWATNLVSADDSNGPAPDVYALDVERDTISRVSVDGQGKQSPLGSSASPAVSGDGRYVAFSSTAPLDDAEPAGTARSSQYRRVFVRDLWSGATRAVSRTSKGRIATGSSSYPAISTDGRFVAFVATADELVPHDGNRSDDVLLHDAVSGRTTLVSRGADNRAGNRHSRFPAISGDGRYVAFTSDASNLACARRCSPSLLDVNLVSDVFVFDRLTERVTRASGPTAGPDPWWQASAGATLDATGAVVAFSSRHPIDSDDLIYDYDVFIRTRREPAGVAVGGHPASRSPHYDDR